MILLGRRNHGLYTLALMIIERRHEQFLVLGFPSSCGDVQPQRTSLGIRTETQFIKQKQKRGTVAWKPHS